MTAEAAAMKKNKLYLYAFLAFVVMMLASCQKTTIDNGREGTTAENSITKIDALTPLKPLPDEPSPEIENSAKILLRVLQINEDAALDLAKLMYCFYLPELKKAKVLSADSGDGNLVIRVTGKDNSIYKLYIRSIGEYKYIRAIWMIDKNGNEIEYFHPMSSLIP